MVAEISKANFDKEFGQGRGRRFSNWGRCRTLSALLSRRAWSHDKLARSHRPDIQLGHHGCRRRCSVSLSTPTSHHGVLLLRMMLITLLCSSRRAATVLRHLPCPRAKARARIFRSDSCAERRARGLIRPPPSPRVCASRVSAELSRGGAARLGRTIAGCTSSCFLHGA